MVLFGLRNSRMKDYFDVHALLREGQTDDQKLNSAITATFKRRRTNVPDGVPSGLSEEFHADAGRQRQWQAFLEKNRLKSLPLEEVVRAIRERLAPVLDQVRQNLKA
jgi:hypothetical protein